MTRLLPVLVTGSFIPVRLLMLELKCEGKVEHCLLPGGDIRVCAVVTVSTWCRVTGVLATGDVQLVRTQHPSAVLSLHPAPVRTKVGTGGSTTYNCQRHSLSLSVSVSLYYINKLHCHT